MIDTKERIARSNIYSIFGKLMNNQAAGRIEDDEIYDDFTAFLNDLYDLLGIGG